MYGRRAKLVEMEKKVEKISKQLAVE